MRARTKGRPGAVLMSAEIHAGTTLESGIPKALFTMGPNDARSFRFAATADGRRILVSGEPKTAVWGMLQISVVLNRLAELQK